MQHKWQLSVEIKLSLHHVYCPTDLAVSTAYVTLGRDFHYLSSRSPFCHCNTHLREKVVQDSFIQAALLQINIKQVVAETYCCTVLLKIMY